eukprot:TRINITY_DN3836_c0_g1_i1.p4 TRINITY_DN3836_c0_g1~~TRINITY_DN3836_c0_g1_i1.p4  ORF type:complete len:102 (-),score=12.31 TRINITY_DN3836_c0_g1_i1:217-522(-)
MSLKRPTRTARHAAFKAKRALLHEEARLQGSLCYSLRRLKASKAPWKIKTPRLPLASLVEAQQVRGRKDGSLEKALWLECGLFSLFPSALQMRRYFEAMGP